jgi:type I restriction enzyme M protein
MAKKTTPSAAPKADIDFEKELWDAANELRGAVAENQYKDYVLSLLFLKHLSERYEVRKQELQLSFFDPKSDYYNLDQQLQNEVLEDELEYQAKNVEQKPRRQGWRAPGAKELNPLHRYPQAGPYGKPPLTRVRRAGP